ncbi:MAG: hypothetical protein VX624_03220, partial [Pseudomonadota bacterium]|nr:hypothetical protein [Pseudomonadota bacterium]
TTLSFKPSFMNRPRYLPAHYLRECRAGLFLLAPIRRDHCFEFQRQSNSVQEFRLSVEALELVLDIRVDPLQGVAAEAFIPACEYIPEPLC